MKRTITVDDRTGATELFSHLTALAPASVQIVSERMEFGDFAFDGYGPRGLSTIGIERKRLSDAINSMRTGRFSGHQLKGLIDQYDFLFLIIEETYRCDPETGLLQVPDRQSWDRGWRDFLLGRSTIMYAELHNWLTTLELHTPIRIRHTPGITETAVMLLKLEHYFNNKTWEEHRGHMAFNLSSRPPGVIVMFEPPLTMRVAKELPGIGWEKSRAVSMKFKSPLQMTLGLEAASHLDLATIRTAAISDWATVPGIGKKLAEQAVKGLLEGDTK